MNVLTLNTAATEHRMAGNSVLGTVSNQVTFKASGPTTLFTYTLNVAYCRTCFGLTGHLQELRPYIQSTVKFYIHFR
jgi:hypothetical protein